jgi:hypothetical protein
VDNYSDSMSKMALALTSSQLAKNFMVEDFGIGEDLPFTFFFWEGGDLLFAVQLRKDRMSLPVSARISLCSDMCSALCSFWDVTAISFIAEGFETLDKTRLEGRELRQAFVEEHDLVRECLTVTHGERNFVNNQLEMTLLSLPYHYEVGRTIDWGKPLGYTSGTDTIFKTSSISKMIFDAIDMDTFSEVTEEDAQKLFQSISHDGFNIEFF